MAAIRTLRVPDAKNAALILAPLRQALWGNMYESMNKLIFVILASLSNAAIAATLEPQDLVGHWVPSDQIPTSSEVVKYNLTINQDLSATYEAVGEQPFELACKHMPSSTQQSVFVFYCYLRDQHLITLSLSGWVQKRGGKMFYGYEYWLGSPEPGSTYGGVPVSFVPARP